MAPTPQARYKRCIKYVAVQGAAFFGMSVLIGAILRLVIGNMALGLGLYHHVVFLTFHLEVCLFVCLF